MNTYLKSAAVALCLAASQQAAAISFECKLDIVHRTISVAYPEQTPVPCQVQYTKEGDTQILWQAENSEGYCEAKAREFAAKHESWGWQCNSLHISAAENSPSESVIAAE